MPREENKCIRLEWSTRTSNGCAVRMGPSRFRRSAEYKGGASPPSTLSHSVFAYSSIAVLMSRPGNREAAAMPMGEMPSRTTPHVQEPGARVMWSHGPNGLEKTIPLPDRLFGVDHLVQSLIRWREPLVEFCVAVHGLVQTAFNIPCQQMQAREGHGDHDGSRSREPPSRLEVAQPFRQQTSPRRGRCGEAQSQKGQACL